MNLVKTISTYVDETGSTWYRPKKKEKSAFDLGVEKGILTKKDGLYTLPGIASMEDTIAKYAIAHLHYNEDSRFYYPEKFLDLYIGLYEQRENIKLDKWQKDAVYKGMNNNVFILTGGPGTGKTAVLKCIYFCLTKILKTDDIIFTAPTGKAARRITESVGQPACTVAKALGLKTENSKPKHISNLCVIVDEISMLDTITAHALFSATDLSTKLILVGDVQQLPSVGYGSVLRDLIDGGLPCTKLEKTFRQASESGLFANIEQIKQGLHNGFEKRDDFKVFTSCCDLEATNIMVNEFLKAVSKYGLEQVVCLTPYRRKGENCAIRLNKILQDILNPSDCGPEITYTVNEEDGFSYDITLRIGDPVMQLVNGPFVANGDVGVVSDINDENNLVKVKFIDCTVIYTLSRLPELALAYAMSIHKSQGSEYACVITSALPSDMDMLSRNTIYTAVTRAKKECIVITNGNTAKKACKRESGYERITKLKEQIQYQEQKYKLYLAMYAAAK